MDKAPTQPGVDECLQAHELAIRPEPCDVGCWISNILLHAWWLIAVLIFFSLLLCALNSDRLCRGA